MYKRNDLTPDKSHYDYIYYYEEMTKQDWNYIKSYVGELEDENKVKCGGRSYYTDEGDRKMRPLYTYKNFCCGFDIETSTIQTCNLVNGKKDWYSAMYVAQFSIRPTGRPSCIGIRFRLWSQVREFFQYLPKLWGLHRRRSEVILVYVHNLDYETSYLKHRLNIDQNTFFGKSRQRPIKYLAEGSIYFHDSFSMTNMGLAKLAETYQTRHQKAVGDIDHSIVRNFKTPLTRRDEKYIFNDVFVLSDFAERIYQLYNTIPDTATQILSNQVKQYALEYGESLVGAERWNRWTEDCTSDYQLLDRIHGYIFGFEYKQNDLKRHVSGIVNPDHFTPFNRMGVPPPPEGCKSGERYIYDFYQWLYRGGIAKSNSRYTSSPNYLEYGVQQPVGGWDYTSSYPFVMTAFNYPMGRFEVFKGDIDQLCLEYDSPDFENWRYIIWVELYDVKATTDYCIESVSKVKAEGVVEDNGRIYKADKLIACLTDCDYILYRKFYKWDSERSRITQVWRAKAAPLPEYLLRPMWEAGRKKQELKHVEGMETDYLLNKIAFNTFYGLCVRQPVYNNYIFGNEVAESGYITTELDRAAFFGQETTTQHTIENNIENIRTDKPESCKRETFSSCTSSFILSPYWGIWCSSFARFNLLNTIFEVGEDSESFTKDDGEIVRTNDTLYCDTDSLYFINPYKHKWIIDRWNSWVRARVLPRLPEEYHKSLGSLGQFDNIAEDESHGYSDTFINFKTLGSKRYIKEIQLPKKKKIKCTVAGLPKGALERFCKRTHRCIYKEFNNLMDLCIDSQDLSTQDKVKLGRIYHDEVMEFFIGGERVVEYSSCTLYPIGFTLKMKPLYLSHLQYIAETIQGGKNANYDIYR